MVGRFLRLRWALVRGGFRAGNTAQRVGAILNAILGLAAGVGGFFAGIGLGFLGDPWQSMVVQLGLGLVFLGWIIGPITIAGTDAAMDPAKFGLLPLTRRDLALGLGASALVGPGGLATSLMLVGVVIGLAQSVAGVPLLVVGALLFLLLCAMGSRFLVSLVGLGLRKRGTRDVMAVAVPLAVIVLTQLPNIIAQTTSRQSADQLRRELEIGSSITRWFPSSFAVETMLVGHSGRLLPGLLELLGGVAVLVPIGFAWSMLLRKVMVNPPVSDGPVKALKADKAWVPRVLQRFRPRVRAVAGKDLKLMFREPAQRVQVVLIGIFGLAALVVPMILLRGQPLAVFIIVGVALLVGMSNGNMYGYDGSSMWVNVAAGDDAAGDILGKLLARVLVFVPVLAVASAVMALMLEPSLLLSVVGLTVGMGLVVLGLACVQSVMAPYPVTYSEDSLMATNQGSMMAVVMQFVAFPVIAVLVGPFLAVAMIKHASPLLASLAGLGSMLVGALACWGGYKLAAAFGRNRQPELLVQISKRAEA